MTGPRHGDADLTPFTALSEQLRRRLFVYVASTDEAVGRTEAAEALGITRSVAAFHMDKLAEVGLFAIEYRRPPGRRGPGAGRPTKFYRALVNELVFSVPERRYELAAAILSEAMAEAEAGSISVSEALRVAARSFGRAIGAGSEGPDEAGSPNSLERVATVLTSCGYEPFVAASHIELVNCPFRALAETQPQVICKMNLRMVKGLLKGAGATDLAARAEPTLGRCCVRIKARALRAR
jgi:predicted ArsR family transcriptional regulator